MSILNIFKRKNQQVNVNNDLYKSLYGFLAPGFKLSRDELGSNYIKYGYESNPDVFSISNHIAGLFSRISIIPYQNDKEIEDPMEEYFADNAADITYHEFKYNWEMFSLITGNSIIYTPVIKGGNNAGRRLSFDIMPTQNVEIISGGWRQPVGRYVLDIDDRYEYDPTDVWHSRLFPNLTYENGANFMGISPLKVAAMVITSQNAGYEITSDVLKHGIQPGILTKISEEYDKKTSQMQESDMRKKWRRASKGKIPLFTMGDLRYIKVGYDNLKDLQIIENSKDGMRVLCNIWAVPLQAFNDTSASTYNNMLEADKAIYKKRVMPDVERYTAGLNKIWKPFGIEYEADYSGVESLRGDMSKLATALGTLVNNKLIGRDEARNIINNALNMNLDEIDIEGMTLEDMINEPQISFPNIDKNMKY